MIEILIVTSLVLWSAEGISEYFTLGLPEAIQCL